ncbi:MAG: hypothetical protein AB1416_12305, partial [Actinomycetota bacterium]
ASGARLDAARALGVAPSPVPLLGAGEPEPGAVANELVASPVIARRPGRVTGIRVASKARIVPGRGTVRVRYRLSADARVVFTVRRSPGGARVSRFARSGARGDNVLVLTARAGRTRALAPGRYVIAARAVGDTRELAVGFRVGGPNRP